jgi:6-phosphogluconate dehydrogenase
MAAYTETMKIVHVSDAATQKQDTHQVTGHETSLDRVPLEGQQDPNAMEEDARRSRVISQWLLDMAARALVDSPGPEKFAVRVSDSEEGRWTVIAAIDESIQAPVLTGALYERLSPGGDAGFSDNVLSVLRIELEGNRDV